MDNRTARNFINTGNETVHKHSLFEIISGGSMQENKKKWMELCERAADEQDSKKLAVLILQINYILEAKELRLKGAVTTTPTTAEDDIANLAL
jgi:hypothetical protein